MVAVAAKHFATTFLGPTSDIPLSAKFEGKRMRDYQPLAGR